MEVGSDVQNIRTEDDIDLNNTLRPLNTYGPFSQTGEKCKEELLIRMEQARKSSR
jgi:hypothetical protein